jgi:hypothetical protein
MQIDLEQECLLIHKDEAMSVRIRVDVFVFFITQQSKLTRASSLSVWASLVTTACYAHALPSLVSHRGPASVPCSLCLSKSLTFFYFFLHLKNIFRHSKVVFYVLVISWHGDLASR